MNTRARNDCNDVRCNIYMRLSDGRVEHETFPRREAKLRRHARQLDWTVVDVVIENDVMPPRRDGKRANASAFKRRRIYRPDGTWEMRVWRPGFRSILDDLEGGKINAVLAEDLDRSLRDPRDAQDFLDVVKGCGGHAASLSGSLKLTNGGSDSERLMLEMLVSVARKASADTARRVSEGRERTAQAGRHGGGPRKYGFELDGVTLVEHECAEIRQWADAVLSNISTRSIAKDLRDRDVPSAHGLRWQAPTVRDILLRPRNAAISVHDKQEIAPATWAAILSEDTWRAVVAKLKDPSGVVEWTDKNGKQRSLVRGTNVGRAPCYLGTGLYMCHCGALVEIRCKAGKSPAYRCGRVLPNGKPAPGDRHVTRNVANVDAAVIDRIVARLERDDLVELAAMPANDGLDLTKVRKKIRELKELEKGYAADYARYVDTDGDEGISRDAMLAGCATARKGIAEREALLAARTDRSPLAAFVGAADVRAVWAASALGVRRAIVAMLVNVTIKPLPELVNTKRFDESLITIAPRTAPVSRKANTRK